MIKNLRKIEEKDDLRKILNDYIKVLNDLKDRQSQLIIEGKLRDKIEN